MSIKFNDRFNRIFLDDNKFFTVAIGYDELSEAVLFNRTNLPSNFRLDGKIIWVNTKLEWHCTTGPAETHIDGEMKYLLNYAQVTALEVLMS